MKLRLAGIAALALGALVILAPQASSLGLVYSLKVSDDQGGPFRHVIEIKVKNDPKSTFWRVKNDGEITRHLLLESRKNFDGYKAAWSRGNDDISNAVAANAYEFRVKAHKSVTFKTVIKKGNNADLAGCLAAKVQDLDEVTTDVAAVGVNGECDS